MITIDIAIIATALGIIVTLWRFGTIIASVITTNQRAHDQLTFNVRNIQSSLDRLKRRVHSIEDVITEHWKFVVRDDDITDSHFEDEE